MFNGIFEGCCFRNCCATSGERISLMRLSVLVVLRKWWLVWVLNLVVVINVCL